MDGWPVELLDTAGLRPTGNALERAGIALEDIDYINAHATGTDEEITAEFRRVRDEIRRVFEAYAAGLKEGRALN